MLHQQRSASVENAQLVSTSQHPRAILKSCTGRYQSVKAYQDSAYVRLAYLSKGQPTEDRAPMQVAWEANGKIGLQVYAVTAGPTESGRWHLSLGNTYPELVDQVFSRQLPKRVDLPWLLSEPLVSESLSAGLGGFPPQLDLLLSREPLSRLVDEATALSLLEPQSIDGSRCWIVSLSRNSLTYVFWIDQQSSLLRRLELPKELLPQEILADESIANLSLSIEFENACFDQAVDWSQFRVKTDSTQSYVNRFVAPPPALPINLLGKQIPAFRLLTPSGAVAFDSTVDPKRKASVLMWLADHPACLAAAEQMQALQQQLKQMGVDEGVVEFVAIWAESQPPNGMNFEQLQQQWKLPGKLALDRDAAGRDLFQVHEAPTVAILDGRGMLHFVDVRLNPVLDRALAPLVSRVIEGVDVAAELKRAQQSSQVRFHAELAQAATADAASSQRNKHESYPPESMQLVQREKQDFPTRIISLAQDSNFTIWTLLGDGTLQGFDAGLESLQKYSTQWNDISANSARLLPSPDGKLFALSAPGSIQVFDTKSQHSIRYVVPEPAEVIDMQWLTLASTGVTRLVAITSGKQVMLLDPENRQQLSGNCPSEPMAILPQKNRGDLDGLVVLSNGSLEPLKISPDVGIASASPIKHALPEPSKQLTFRPSFGPWQYSRASKHEQTLAVGWLAEEEPALLFLDENLQPFWKYRLPYDKSALGKHRITSAASPGNGSTIWAVLDTTNTIHVLRGDVMWSDHFRPAGRVSGLALIPSGDRLTLVITAQSTITVFDMQ